MQQALEFTILWMWNSLFWASLVVQWLGVCLLERGHRFNPWPRRFHISSVSVQSFSHAQYLQPMDCSTLGFPVHHQLLELTQTHVHWVGNAIQPSHPLSSPSPAFKLSQHQHLFQWVSSSHQVAKYCSVSFSISASNEYSGMISFRIDWFDLFAVQGSLKSLL